MATLVFYLESITNVFQLYGLVYISSCSLQRLQLKFYVIVQESLLQALTLQWKWQGFAQTSLSIRNGISLC